MRILIIFCLITAVITVRAQNNTFRVGLKAGIAKYDYGLRQININDSKSFTLSIINDNVGFLGGAVFQLKLGKFVIQHEVLFNTSKVNYSISNRNFSLADTLLSESYQDLDIPLMLGFKSGIIRLIAGPVGHLHLSSTSELFQIDSYQSNFEKLQYGWQAGLGLDIWKFMIDVRYEGNFSKFGDHISFGGRRYNFNDNPTRLIGTIGLLF